MIEIKFELPTRARKQAVSWLRCMFRFQMSYQRKFKLENRVAVTTIMFQVFMHRFDMEFQILF